MKPRPGRWMAPTIARRELRTGLRGFGVFLGCLFLGVFTVGAVGSFSRSVEAGLAGEARSLLGGDVEVTLRHRLLPAEADAFLGRAGRLSRVDELRAMASIRAVGGETRHLLVEVKAVDGAYPLYGSVGLVPDTGLDATLGRAGGDYGAAVERSLLDRLGIELGDELTLGALTYRIRAVVTAEPDRVVRPFTLGPRVLVAAASLSATGLVVPGSLVTHAYRVRLPTLADGASGRLVEAFAVRFPNAGWRMRTHEQAAPRVRRVLDRLRVDLTLVGLAALLVGGLGVRGAVRGYLADRMRSIAAMKCAGATGGVVFGGYFVQILFLAGVGVTVALAGGAAVPWLIAHGSGPWLPVPVRVGLYPAPLLGAAAFGMLVAGGFSLRPLAAAAGVSPAVLFRGYDLGEAGRLPRWVPWAEAGFAGGILALAGWFTGDRRLTVGFAVALLVGFGVFHLLGGALVWAARRVPRPHRPAVRLGLANLCRPGAPTRSLVFSLGLGLTALVAVALVQADLTARVSDEIPEEVPSHFVLGLLPDQVEAFDGVVAAVEGVTRVERQPTLRGRITAIAGRPVDQVRVAPGAQWAVRGDRFLTYSALPSEGTVVSAGGWWPESYDGPPLVSLTSDLARGFGVTVGDTLTVNVLGREVTAEIACLREVDWSSMALNFALVFTPGVLERAPQTWLATVYAPPEQDGAVVEAVAGRFPNASVVGVREVLANVTRVLDKIAAVFRMVAGVVLVTGFLVLAGAVSADQHRRVRDAVVFKVCGATRWDVLGAFAVEFLLLGVVTAGVSALTGAAAALAVVRGAMGAPFALHPGPALVILVVGVVFIVGLGLLGTAGALRRPPAPYLRGE